MFELERLNGTKYTRFMEGLPKKRNPRNPLNYYEIHLLLRNPPLYSPKLISENAKSTAAHLLDYEWKLYVIGTRPTF